MLENCIGMLVVCLGVSLAMSLCAVPALLLLLLGWEAGWNPAGCALIPQRAGFQSWDLEARAVPMTGVQEELCLLKQERCWKGPALLFLTES